MRCNVCNSYIPDGVGECLNCKTKTEPETTCPKCGATSVANARFCRKCGNTLPSQRDGTTAEITLDGRCPKCRCYVPVGLDHCLGCGAKVSLPPDPNYRCRQNCNFCGAERISTGRFCSVCGRFLGSDSISVVCSSCGSRNNLKYARCQFCGAEL